MNIRNAKLFVLAKRSQSGVSLIELMVSMVIALIVFAGVVQTMLDNKTKFLMGEQLSLVQENARFAIEEISRDLRMAGYQGCSGGAQVANTINGSPDSFYDGFGVEGWDSSEGASAYPDEFESELWSFNDANKTDPDAFSIRKADGDDSLSVTGHDQAAAVIDVAGIHGIEAGTILVAATPDCSQVSIFQFTGGNTIKVGHNMGSSVSPGNCSGDLGGTYDCSSPPGTLPPDNMVLPNGSQIMEFSSNSYYIGPSSIDPSIPALYKEQLVESSGTFATAAVELLIGVENMQVRYGVDTDVATAFDGQANRYVTANEITGVAPFDWNNVVSVRVSFLLRSLVNVWPEDTTFTYEGESYTDRFIRQRLTTTVQLRNMALVN